VSTLFALRETTDLDPARSSGGRVEVAFTDASIDLGGGDGFTAALAGLADALGVPVAWAHQVHGDDVVTVEHADGSAPEADGLVTTQRGLALMVRVADCVPVVLADQAAGVVGVAHAGRRGVELDVVTRTVERMRELGASDLRAWVGPHICGRCYEVPATMRDEVAARVPATYAETSSGTPALDLGAGVAAQLAAAGVPATVVPGCTREDAALHSYRRDGEAAGRFAGLVWLT
jgi:YfiH family protein